MVGLECERIWEEYCALLTAEQWERARYRHGLDDHLADLQAVPAKLIRVSDGRSARKIVADLAKDAANALPDDLPECMEQAVHALRDREKVIGQGRLVRMQKRQPKGKRAEILQRGCTYVRDAFGLDVTARFVDRCWKELRSFQSRLQQDV